MSSLFYIYRSKLSGSLFAFKEKQPEHMVRNDDAFECIKVSNDINSYIYKLQHDRDENLKEITKLKKALEVYMKLINELGIAYNMNLTMGIKLIEAQKQIKEIMEGK